MRSTGDRSVPVAATTLAVVTDPTDPSDPIDPTTPSDSISATADDAELLDGLESDLVAVEEAMGTLDRIAADGVGGSAAAEQIASVVSAQRFPDGRPVTRVDLTVPS